MEWVKRNVSDVAKTISIQTNRFVELCESCSIHGAQYLVEKGRPLSERLLWVLLLIIGIIANCIIMNGVYVKWQETPVVVSMKETTIPIHRIPFPAVTVCPQTKFISMGNNISRALLNETTNDNRTAVDAVALVCGPDIYVNGTDYLTMEAIHGLFKVSEHPLVTTRLCKFHDREVNCLDMFHPILTQEGICYTSNMLNHNEIFRNPSYFKFPNHYKYSQGSWSIEDGYLTEEGDVFPSRTGTRGVFSSLLVYMLTRERNLNISYYCNGGLPGFKVVIHHPAEMPDVSRSYFIASLGKEVMVSAKPDIVTAESDLKDYSIDQRLCLFQDENPLKFFKIYTVNNCRLECLTELTYSKCGCISFHMPRENEKIPYCGANKKRCTQEAGRILSRAKTKEVMLAHNISAKCSCLPSCDFIDYKVDTSLALFDFIKTLGALNTGLSAEYKHYKDSSVRVFFDATEYVSKKRIAFQKTSDFIAKAAGTLNLFIGLSFFGAVELFYFSMFKPRN